MPADLTMHSTGPSVTPLARKIASASAFDLSAIAGSGSNGRIMFADLGLPARSAPTAAPAAPAPAGVATTSASVLSTRCDIGPLLVLRERLNAELAMRGVVLSIDDMLLRTMALALSDVLPAYAESARVDLALPGVSGPAAVVRDVLSFSLSALARQTRALDGDVDAKQDRAVPAFVAVPSGAEFAIPVIEPPCPLLLAVGEGVEQPWKVGGVLGLATVASATVGFDPRAIDAGAAARFIAAFRARVETPLLICC